MTNSLSGYTLRLTASADLVTETCYRCGALFAMAADFKDARLRDRRDFFCPNGHAQHYIGKTDTEKLKESKARETALRDQLSAAIRDAETTRIVLLRDRHRFANGVCPCCTRSFENVRRHMTDQHPDYDVAQLGSPTPTFLCSCGRDFETLHGLRTHQGSMRWDGWDSPDASSWQSHLTVV